MHSALTELRAKIKHIRILYFVCIFCFCGIISQKTNGQSSNLITLSGSLQDSETSERMPFAMLILHINNIEGSSDFTQSDKDGNFSFSLPIGNSFQIEAFFLGYEDYKKVYPALKQDTTLVISVKPATAILKEVIVRDTFPPIITRGDTVIYNAKLFYTGRERKLNELLDKLPGLAVDDQNRITYRGQAVETLLVEGERFFGGNSELALTGLPADAVGKVKVINDYNELGFSLGHDLERKIALNIELKKEKSNIIFGDATAGIGPPKNYSSNINLFNYKKSRNLYLLGGVNNTNTELISMRQRLQLLNGSLGLLKGEFQERFQEFSIKPQPYSTKASSELIALGLDFSPFVNFKVNVSAFVSNQQNDYESTIITTANSDRATLFQEREHQFGVNEQTAGMLRIDARSKLGKNKTLNVNLRLIGGLGQETTNQNYFVTSGDNRNSQSLQEQRDYKLDAAIEYIEQINGGHTHHLSFKNENGRTKSGLSLSSDVTFLSSLINWEQGNPFALNQKSRLSNTRMFLQDRYVRRLNASLYLTGQINLDWQQTQFKLDGVIDSMESVRLLNQSGQSGRIHLTALLGRWKVAPSMALTRRYWKWDEINSRQRVLFLPELLVERPINRIGTLVFSYNRYLGLLSPDWYYPEMRIISFTSYQDGQPGLAPFPSSRFEIGLIHSNPLSDASWSFSIEHGFVETNQVVTKLLVLGNERKTSFTRIDESERTSSISGFYQFEFPKSELRILSRISYDQGYFVFGAETQPSEIKREAAMLNTTYLQTIGKHSNIKLRSNVRRSRFYRSGISNVIYHANLSIQSKTAIGYLTIEPSVNMNLYNFTVDLVRLVGIEASIRYREPNAPWAYQIQGAAPLNGRSVQTFQQSNLFFSQKEQLVFPAFVIGSLQYHF